MFADAELIGIPHRLTFGEKGLDNGTIEYKARTDTENREIKIDEVVNYIGDILSAN
jgi:prolyl-tRNA synthetase